MNKLNIVEKAKNCICSNDCGDCEYRQYERCYKHLILDLLSTINCQNEKIADMKIDYLYLNADFEAMKANIYEDVKNESEN